MSPYLLGWQLLKGCGSEKLPEPETLLIFANTSSHPPKRCTWKGKAMSSENVLPKQDWVSELCDAAFFHRSLTDYGFPS